MRSRFALFAGAILGVFICQQAHAVITAPTPLKKFEGDAVYILVGKVEKHYPEKPAMMVAVIEDIKGKAPFRQLPINLKVADEKTAKKNQIEPLLKRFGPDQEIIFFLQPHGKKSYVTFAFVNGTWFQMQGTKVDKEQVVFALLSAEPYFRKSFKGTTEELRQLLKDHAAGKAKLPELDEKEIPGLGPEYAPKKGAAHPHESLRSSWGLLCFHYTGGGHLFGVIPTIGLGAPLAILALLFPSLFGGVFVLFRQWLAFITLISLNSTLLIGHWALTEYYPSLLRGSWWATDAAVWFLTTMLTFVCAFWAWRRQLNSLSNGEPDAPQKTELMVLAFMSASGVATTIVLWCLEKQISWSSNIGWTLTVVMTLGILAGTLYKAWGAFTKPAPFGSMPLATEGIILGSMLLGHLAFVPLILGGNLNTAGTAEGGQQSGTFSAKVGGGNQKWVFTLDSPAIKGMFASSPIVDGDAIYASYSLTNGRAVMVRLDRQTGIKKWECFGENDDLRQMISTPCLADGKLYFGEGFHRDLNCHVFCVDAEKGDELWRFKTGGQTESSPTVVNGKVYIGAGNDGVYCLDATKKGAKIWRYPNDDFGGVTRVAYQAPILRFGGGMVVVGNRLYCATGEDRDAEGDKGETAVFCLDAGTGKPIWKTPAPFPVWSTPVIKDGLIYVTSGNGDVLTDAPAGQTPGGALQCLDLETGKEKWQIKVGNGIIESPALDAHRIYFGCRDGQLYCVNRSDGKERWRRFLEAPIVASPVLDCDPVLERTLSVFAVSTAGKACCLNPLNGEIVWSFDLTGKLAAVTTNPRLVVSRSAAGYVRQLYFGCGLGGGPLDTLSNRPVFYCVEDHVRVE